MKAYFLILPLVLLAIIVSAQSKVETDEFRNLFFYGWEGDCGANVLVDKFKSKKGLLSPVQKAYYGAALTTLANCKVMPYGKLKVFNSGKNMIEEAIEEDKSSGEIRFLRFSVQSHIPQLLYYDDRDVDKPIILESLILQVESGNASVFTWEMIDFMVTYGNLSDRELKKLNLLIARK